MSKNKYQNINFFILLIFLFQTCLAKDSSFLNKRKYPNRKSIKGLNPDFQQIDQIVGNSVHSVTINFVWSNWQPK